MRLRATDRQAMQPRAGPLLLPCCWLPLLLMPLLLMHTCLWLRKGPFVFADQLRPGGSQAANLLLLMDDWLLQSEGGAEVRCRSLRAACW